MMEAPSDILVPSQIAYAQLNQLGIYYHGGGLPQACKWTTEAVARNQMDIAVFKYGTGVHVRYGFKESTALEMANSPSRVRVELPQGWAAIFGVSECPQDGELTTRLACITSHCDTVSGFTTPWQIRLEGQPWRIGEEGDICATALPPQGRWDDGRAMADAPLCAKQMPTFVEATRDVENRSMLTLGRDSNWPLSITLASEVDPTTSLSVIYEINWNGINWEDDEKSTDWCWDKFLEAARADNLSAPPALQRAGKPWMISLRKENNALRIILRENTRSTPEETGEPIMLLFAPRAVVKFRTVAPDAKQRLCNCISAPYQGRYQLTEQLIAQEWAMIASLGSIDEEGNVTESGTIPQHYRAQTSEAASGIERAFVESIYEAGLTTQNYDKGVDNFVRKYERNEAMSATVAMLQGRRNDHGWAVYFKQGPRRCLLLDTQDGLSSEETLWTALAAWATFKPRKTSPRKYPGKLYYPAEASHIFEKYWNYLTNLDEHPDFASESPICQERIWFRFQGPWLS
jgi:hypothetical protein